MAGATNSDFSKLVVAMRYYLLGNKMFMAERAMNYALGVHTGTRKDGVTPEFQHQIEMAHFLRTQMPNLMFKEETIAVVMLHDLIEDYDITIAQVASDLDLPDVVCKGVISVTKPKDFNKKDPQQQAQYFLGISEDPIGSIVKGVDRINNLGSMRGTFSLHGQRKYIEEAEMLFLPMLKSARRKFPEQECAYEIIKFVLNSQLSLLKEVVEYERLCNCPSDKS